MKTWPRGCLGLWSNCMWHKNVGQEEMRDKIRRHEFIFVLLSSFSVYFGVSISDSHRWLLSLFFIGVIDPSLHVSNLLICVPDYHDFRRTGRT